MLGIAITAVLLVFGSLLWWRESQSQLEGIALELLSEGVSGGPISGVRSEDGFVRMQCVVVLSISIVIFFILLFVGIDLPRALVCALMSGCLAFLLLGRYRQSRANRDKKELEYFVPVTMERLVMAVESGLDVISAIQTIVELELSETPFDRVDPVTKLLKRIISLTNEGMRFEEALSTVSRQLDCPAVSHAFVHLAVAYKEGGELIQPLRELSDSCQAMYQESVEEDIAKMPVKATLPLVLTFAGLIVLFLATPLVQVMTFVEKASFQKGAHK